MVQFARKVGTILLILGFCGLPIHGMSVAAIGTVGLAVSAALAPVITPVANEIANEVRKELPNVLGILSQKSQCKRCVTAASLYCRTESGTNWCKGRCQNIIQMGAGYNLKIRYADDWNMLKCVNFAVKRGKHTFKPENAKSIAIYGKSNFDLAVKIISMIESLDLFVLTNGQSGEIEGKNQGEILELVKKAQIEKERLDKVFQQYVQENFGPQ